MRGRKPKTHERREADQRLGRRIERLRLAAGKNCVQMARELGVSRRMLYAYEAGISSCPAVTLAKIEALCEESKRGIN